MKPSRDILTSRYSERALTTEEPTPVQSAARLIDRIVKLAAGVERCKYDAFCGNSFFMHTNRDSAAVVDHGSRAVLFKIHIDLITIAGQMLIHGIVNDLIDQMV